MGGDGRDPFPWLAVIMLASTLIMAFFIGYVTVRLVAG